MSRKKKTQRPAGQSNTTTPAAPKKSSNKPQVVAQWNEYFGSNDSILENWQKLCRDLGLGDKFTSKTQCRKALRKVWVNIPDFLNTENKPADVVLFPTERELAAYTAKNRKSYPKKKIAKGSPLRDLLAHIF